MNEDDATFNDVKITIGGRRKENWECRLKIFTICQHACFLSPSVGVQWAWEISRVIGVTRFRFLFEIWGQREDLQFLLCCPAPEAPKKEKAKVFAEYFFGLAASPDLMILQRLCHIYLPSDRLDAVSFSCKP